MRRRCLFLLLSIALLAGCTAKPPLPAPPPAAPKIAAGLIPRDNGWEIPTLKSGGYLWSPDLRWIAFQTSTGLWAVSPDGAAEHLLQPGDRWRRLAGWWDGSLVFVDYGTGDGSATIRAATPGGETRSIAELPGSDLTMQHQTALYGRYLGVWYNEAVALRIDLLTGEVKEMAAGITCSLAWPSQTGRYVITKDACEWGRLHMYDLLEGTSLASESASYPHGVAWAPAGDRWGALAAAPGSGSTSGSGGAFGTRIDVGDPGLQVRHLVPPVPLRLRGTNATGLWWSPDGMQVAVMAEIAPPSDGRYRDAVNEIWVVTVATNTWRKLGKVQFVHIQGWHPSGEYLVVWEIVASAGSWGMGRMAVADGRVEWLEPRRPEDWPQTKIDDRLWVVHAQRGWAEPTAYYQSGDVTLPLWGAQQYRASDLQFRGPYVSWLEEHAAGPGLIVTR